MTSNSASVPRTQTALADARARMDGVFARVPMPAWGSRPVPERHRLLFYVGHVEAFDWNLFASQLQLPACHPTFDRLFAFGIDPKAGQLPCDEVSDWPTMDEISAYVRRIRERVDDALEEAPPVLVDVAIEHRLMHVETFTYLLHNSEEPLLAVGRGPATRPASSKPLHRMIEIPAGTATLGQPRAGEATGSSSTFGWDNEFGEHRVDVPAFGISRYKVTNAQYLAFVEDGGPIPHFWRRRDGQWLWRTLSGDAALPLDWPVYVSHAQASAYARWCGGSLPTEAQFHRAAFGTPAGEERPYPWGNDRPIDRAQHVARWDPVAVTATPDLDSAFGVAQLVGNGWEWTSSIFAPFPGFEPYPFYPGYSAPFFDGEHYVLKGGSPCTPARLVRRSFRNWFRPDYPYVYATFRCVDH